MITMNAAVTVISFRRFDLIQLGERFDVFVIRLYLTKFIT